MAGKTQEFTANGANLNYYDSQFGWGNAKKCSQGNGSAWGAGASRMGVMYFPGLSAACKGKKIQKVTFEFTNDAGGYNATKTAHFYRSTVQGKIDTAKNWSHRDSSSKIADISGLFHSGGAATVTVEAPEFQTYIRGGDDTFCIYSASASEYLVWTSVLLTVEYSEALTIPVVDRSEATMGDTLPIALKPNGTGFKHHLWWEFGTEGEASYKWGWITDSPTDARSVSWKTAVSELAPCVPNAVEGYFRIGCYTYDASGTLLGTSNSGSIRLHVPANVRPTVNGFQVTCICAESGNKSFIKGKSQARFTITGGTGQYGSTIVDYWIARKTANGYTDEHYAQSVLTESLDTAGTFTYVASVKDSRDRWSEPYEECSITVVNALRLLSCTAERCNEQGESSRDGLYAKLYAEAVFDSTIDPTQQSIKVEYDDPNNTGTVKQVSLENKTHSVLQGDTFDLSNPHSFTFIVSDGSTEISETILLISRSILLSFFGNSRIAIGKNVDIDPNGPNGLDIALPTLFRESIRVEKDLYLTGQLYDGNGNPYAASASATVADSSGGGLSNSTITLWSGSNDCASPLQIVDGYDPSYKVYLFVAQLNRDQGHLVSMCIPRSMIMPKSTEALPVYDFQSVSTDQVHGWYPHIQYQDSSLIVELQATDGNGGQLIGVYAYV